MKTFLTVKLALIPFAVFWALLALGAPAWAIFSAFTLSLAGNLWRFWRGEVFALEIGGTLLFAGFGVAWIAAPLWAGANFLWLSFAALGLISFMSLGLRHPWTADYARAAYPDNATSPQFFVINAAMTALWGALFLVLGACRYFGSPTVVTAAVVITGALISILGPRLAIRFALQRLEAGRETYHWPAPSLTRDVDVDVDVAVIGAGIGGLSAAALLADAGLRVAVFDHHVLAGGYCHIYLRKAHWHGEPVLYRFDAGPHDFSGVWPGGPVTSLLERLGVADRIAWRRVDHTYRLSGTVIDVPRGWREYARLLGERYPQSAAGIGALFEEIHAIFEDMYATGKGRSGIPGSPGTIDDLLAFPKDHPHAFHWMDKPFEDLLAAYVSDPAVIGVVNALSGYLGDGTEKLTCAQMAPIFGYYFKGGHYPIGGSGRLPDVLVDAIEARGGEVHLKTAVQRILVDNGMARGVMLADGRTIRAAAIVSNADIKRTFLELIGPHEVLPEFRARLADAAPANSAFSVHIGVDFVPDIRPATHIETPMRVGIATMSSLDPSAAPPGHATMTLISLLPHEEALRWFPALGAEDWMDWRRSDVYAQRKTEFGDRMIAAVETIVPGLSRHIVYRADASPVTYARYDWASAGSIYGVSRDGRLKGAKSPIRGVVIAGSGNAGAGVEAAVISGAQAAEALLPGLLSRRASASEIAATV